MARRFEQELINQIVETNFEKARPEYELYNFISVKRLRSCSATVYETENFYWLKSYGTIVAMIDKTTDTLYDFLRLVYGYTSTIAQHISKFYHDYGQDKFGTHDRYTWKEV